MAEPDEMGLDDALEWLDTAIAEFFGAIEAASQHIERPDDDAALRLSAKLNGFMVNLMTIAQSGQAAAAAGALPSEAVPAPEPPPEPVPMPEPVPPPEPPPGAPATLEEQVSTEQRDWEAAQAAG